MKKSIVLYAILALIGCSQEEEDKRREINSATEIRFGTEVSSAIASRAPVESEDNGLVKQDITGIQIIRDDSSSPFAGGIQSIAAVGAIRKNNIQDNKNIMEMTPKQYFKADRSDCYFMAYYPEGETISSGKVNYVIDGSQDIMTASRQTAVYDSNNNEVNFSFNHRLTRVKLQVRTPNVGVANAYGSITKASIQVPTNLELEVQGTDFGLNISSTPGVKELSFLPNANQSVPIIGGITQEIGELMIYPQQFNTIKLGFTNKTAAEYTLNWAASPNLLKEGKINTLTIDLTAYEIKFLVSVKPWTAGNGDNGEEETIGGSN